MDTSIPANPKGGKSLLLQGGKKSLPDGVMFGGFEEPDYRVMAEAMKPDSEEEKEEVAERPLKWATNGKLYWLTTETVDTVKPGLYSTGISDQTGPFIAQMLSSNDELVTLPDAKSSEVVKEIEHFWTLKDRFTKFGMLHKRGVMLYGPPGSGKTTTIRQLIKLIVQKYRGIGLFLDHPVVGASCLQSIRKVEPNRPVIALMEDLDELIRRHGLPGYLALLDGEAQVDNIVFIGTTNHISDIDPRLTQRPSRFDRRILVDMPSPLAREAYIKHRIVELAGETLGEDELARWVRLTEDFSIAHLRELIVSVKCLGMGLEESAEILRDMCVPAEEIAASRKIGFSQ